MHRPHRLPTESEAGFQAAVLELARLCGYRCYHTFEARRSAPGFPDVVMVRGHRLLFAELKSASGRVTPAQVDWLTMLGKVQRVEAYLWRPSDWEKLIHIVQREEAVPW